MNEWKATLVVLVSAFAATFAGCDSTSSPDVDMAPSQAVESATTLGTASSVRYNRGDGALGTVYVTSQGLYYDTFVTADPLPPHGKFQLLVDGETEFGPGDPGYVGGRWKIPKGDDYIYLLCPLLPPGRESP